MTGGHGAGRRAWAEAAAQPAPLDPALSALVSELTRATGIRARLHEPMSRYTSLRVGGPADVLFVARGSGSLETAVRVARRAGIRWLLIGRGSNLVFSDAGLRGLVIASRAEGCGISGTRLTAESGLPLARAATEAARAGLSGLEFGLAIPGTVGGAVWANAGAHGSEVASVLEWASVLRFDGTKTRETPASLELAYRDSRLKRRPASSPTPPASGPTPPASGPTLPSGAVEALAPYDVVLEACFLLHPDDARLIAARHAEIRRWRREHQPIELPSAGSVFRNPAGDSAGRLIEAAGLKGRRIGGAVISDRHANFIVNDRGASAADVRALAELARQEVAGRFGVELVYEIQFAGEWAGFVEEER